jgi:hypothetical protein
MTPEIDEDVDTDAEGELGMDMDMKEVRKGWMQERARLRKEAKKALQRRPKRLASGKGKSRQDQSQRTLSPGSTDGNSSLLLTGIFENMTLKNEQSTIDSPDYSTMR